MNHNPDVSAVFGDGVSPDDVRQQLGRILRSNTFRRSKRSQEFLSFIAELAISGEESTINEHMIGIEVFGRGPGYNPAEDAVVRRQAHSLRQRLEAYYRSEGRGDPIRIDVPVGHYVPVFERWTAEAGDFLDSGSQQRKPVSRMLPAVAWVAIIGIVAAASFGVGVRRGREAVANAGNIGTSPALRELWQPWLTSEHVPLICFSSPYGAVVKHYTIPVPVGSQPARLQLTDEVESEFRSALGVDDSGFLYIQPTRNEAKSGEALGGVLLANFFGMHQVKVQGTLSRLLTWDDFRHRNLILLGHSEQNRWVAPPLDDYPLRLEETKGAQKRRIINIRPQGGEPEFFEIDYASNEEDATVEYGLVSMLPGTDRGRQLLIVSGLNTQATLMGIEFLTTPNRVQGLLDQMRVLCPDHSGAWHFQLVLRTEVRDKVPTGSSIELIKVLHPTSLSSPDEKECNSASLSG